LKVLLTGAGGQLGQAVLRSAPPSAIVRPATHLDLDISDGRAVDEAFSKWRPAILINCAAYTSVDAAQSHADLAESINVDGVRLLAEACRRAGAFLIHVSTDYVFDGEQSSPYRTNDRVNPLSVYGRTKWRGEEEARGRLPEASTIVRTSWLYSAFGTNFVRRMLELMGRVPNLRIVSDQVGSPTAAAGLAEVLWAFAARRCAGTYHWTDAGTTSWHGFAEAIAEGGARMGLLARAPVIEPITTSEYPTAARRPPYSVLDRSSTETILGITARAWRAQLGDVLLEMVATRRAETLR
jgi:dTDP-4-dehydrorhamnose reductase